MVAKKQGLKKFSEVGNINQEHRLITDVGETEILLFLLLGKES